jgi:hypothetical protein
MRSILPTNSCRWLERGKRESTLVLLQSISVRGIPEAEKRYAEYTENAHERQGLKDKDWK